MGTKNRIFIFLGNSNNEPARLAHELSKAIDHKIYLFLFQDGPLNDPQSLPFYVDLKSKCSIIDLRFETFDSVKIIFLIFRLWKVIKKDSVVVANSFGPSLILRTKIKHVFFSTGTDVTSFANWQWSKVAGSHKMITMSFFKRILIKNAKLLLIFNQRRNIRRSNFVIAPSETRDPLYRKIAFEIFPPKVPLYSLEYSNVRNYITPSNKISSDERVKILIGCRLDDGLEYEFFDRSNFNDKNPSAILEALLEFNPIVPTDIFFIKKGAWVEKFENSAATLSQTLNLIGLNEMDYRDFIEFMNTVDVVIDSIGPSIPGRVSYDAIALGKFLIVNNLPTYISSVFQPHIFQANDATSLLRVLNSLSGSEFLEHRSNCFHDLDYKCIYENSEIRKVIRDLVRLI